MSACIAAAGASHVTWSHATLNHKANNARAHRQSPPHVRERRETYCRRIARTNHALMIGDPLHLRTRTRSATNGLTRAQFDSRVMCITHTRPQRRKQQTTIYLQVLFGGVQRHRQQLGSNSCGAGSIGQRRRRGQASTRAHFNQFSNFQKTDANRENEPPQTQHAAETSHVKALHELPAAAPHTSAVR